MSLVENRRIGREVRQEHIAHIGAVDGYLLASFFNGVDASIIEAIMLDTWAQLCGLGYSTAKRELREGRGPLVTRLTEGRIGITVSEHKRWIAARTEDHRLRKIRRS